MQQLFFKSYQHFESLHSAEKRDEGSDVTNGFSRSMFLQSLTSFFIYVIIRSSRLEESRKKGVLRNFAKFIGKHLFQRPATLLKKRLWHRGFPVHFAKYLRTAFLTELSSGGCFCIMLSFTCLLSLTEFLSVDRHKLNCKIFRNI